MRGHTQLPMVAPGWMSPQGGTAGRANPTTRLQDGGRLPGLRCGDGRAEGRATAASPGAGRGAEPPRIASAADGRRCGGRRGTRGSKHRRGAAQGPARLPRPPSRAALRPHPGFRTPPAPTPTPGLGSAPGGEQLCGEGGWAAARGGRRGAAGAEGPPGRPGPPPPHVHLRQAPSARTSASTSAGSLKRFRCISRTAAGSPPLSARNRSRSSTMAAAAAAAPERGDSGGSRARVRSALRLRRAAGRGLRGAAERGRCAGRAPTPRRQRPLAERRRRCVGPRAICGAPPRGCLWGSARPHAEQRAPVASPGRP